MSGTLVVGLGNPLMGDDGIGWHVVERLRRDPRFPPAAEATLAGSDLLGATDAMSGKDHVIIIDAACDGGVVGTLTRLDDAALAERPRSRDSAHTISALQSLQLIRLLEPGCARTRFSVWTISVAGARLGPGLSTPLANALPRILDRLIAEIQPSIAIE